MHSWLPRLPAWALSGGGLRSSLGTDRLHCRNPRVRRIATHPSADGLGVRALRRHRRESVKFLFVSERGAPRFSRMVEGAGRAAKLGIKVHAHMLRHACGYALENAGHDTRSPQAHLGHRNIQNTTGTLPLAPDRFKGVLERLASGAVQISWMPLASIRPRDLWALPIRLAARNIKLCSFGKIYVVRLSERIDQHDGYRYSYYRTDASGNKFVRQHGNLPKRLSNSLQSRYMLALNTGCAR